MNVATITMPADEASERYREYAEGLAGRDPTDEDRGVMLGLKAIAKGKSLINITDVFRRCPPDIKGRPSLGIARAHWRHVRYEIDRDGSGRFYQGRDYVSYYQRVQWHTYFRLPIGFIPEPCRKERSAVALVPIIPPNLRPKKAIERYCILFEAEWEPVPPTDPLLLRHLHGSLYVVLAAWNLTSLEKAVLSGRLTDPR